jgi:hypothetical protein
MGNFNNLTTQKIVVFTFAVLFIILQSCFDAKGTNYFLILPSVFLVLTYKPQLLSYFACFALGFINDIFAMQVLGMSSVMFVVLKFIKTVIVSRSHKNYIDLLKEYCIYGLSIFVSAFLVMLVFGAATLNSAFILSIILLILGFFITDYLWLKIFGLFNKK